MILFFTSREDYHSIVVGRRLEERGAKVVWFDYSDFPAGSRVGLGFSECGESRPTLSIGAERIDFSEVTAAWLRRPGRVRIAPHLIDSPQRRWIEHEAVDFLRDYLWCLDFLWAPGPDPIVTLAEHKAHQLKTAATMGFEIPPTLFTNDPDAFLDFYQKHNGRLITKCAAQSFVTDGEGKVELNMHTAVVSPRDLVCAESIAFCPAIFQAYVPKRVELRITVVGTRVFACEIHSQATNRTRHDWRNYDLAHTPHAEHQLPAEVRDLCLGLVKRLGLCYGAIDMILTPDGRYVFVEINPNGQYLWIEDATGMPITEAMCDLLMGGATAL